jgi:hypothetical protein
VLPDSTRADLRTAASSFGSACTLGGWAALYFVDGLFWWPGLLIALGSGLACIQRAREAAATLAGLLEAAVDLHAPALCVAVHISDAEERLTPRLGRELTRVFRKGALQDAGVAAVSCGHATLSGACRRLWRTTREDRANRARRGAILTARTRVRQWLRFEYLGPSRSPRELSS